MRRACASLTLILALASWGGKSARAAYTPLEWQRVVSGHVDPRFLGQRKHTDWIRDRNQNFIDDLIDPHFGARDTVDIIVELNDWYAPADIHAQLDRFGRMTYIPQLVSCALIEDVRVSVLDSLAGLPTVAMVEWQTPLQPALDISPRAVQARRSSVYPTSAEGSSLDGTGVNIAIVDVGVADQYDAFKNPDGSRAFVAGFDATEFKDEVPTDGQDDDGNEPGDGTTNPVPYGGEDHATLVAGIALARSDAAAIADAIAATGTPPCRDDLSDTVAPACSGVAPGAGLIDVRVAMKKSTFFSGSTTVAYDPKDVFEGLDWIARNAERWNIQVVTLSFSDYQEDKGLGALAVTVNALVAQGIVVVVAHGNSDSAGLGRGTQRTGSPGSASYAITVGGINDQDTVSRKGTATTSDDAAFSYNLVGPRSDCTTAYADCDRGAQKPDLSAPAEDVMTVASTTSASTITQYTKQHGTSLAAPAVAGAVALLRQRWNTIDPGSVKDLIRRTADRGVSSFPSGQDWDVALGSGILNTADLVNATAAGDVRFESCVGPAVAPGKPCELASPMPWWHNYRDLVTAAPLEKNVANTITAHVTNDGNADAEVLVSFGVYTFGVGTRIFHHIGTQRKTISAKTTQDVPQPWTPQESGHQCLQVSIEYGYDSDFLNNVTQRNVEVAPSEYEMRVENPFFVPAHFRLAPVSNRPGWECRLDQTEFTLDPFRDPPRIVRISFNGPKNAAPGARASCDVAVYATKRGEREPVLIGGVTVQTFVPEACRLVGQVIDPHGRPLKRARLRFSVIRSPGTLQLPWQKDRTAETDRDGVFSLDALPYVNQVLVLDHTSAGRGEVTVRPSCGVGTLRLELGPSGARVLKPR